VRSKTTLFATITLMVLGFAGSTFAQDGRPRRVSLNSTTLSF